jgi:hypothetical protein
MNIGYNRDQSPGKIPLIVCLNLHNNIQFSSDSITITKMSHNLNIVNMTAKYLLKIFTQKIVYLFIKLVPSNNIINNYGLLPCELMICLS